MAYLAHTNEQGRRQRGDVAVGDEFEYVGPRNEWFNDAIVDETVDGQPVEKGTRALVTHVLDFDYPFVLELDNGHTIRVGSNIHRRWNRATSIGEGDIVRLNRDADSDAHDDSGKLATVISVDGYIVIVRLFTWRIDDPRDGRRMTHTAGLDRTPNEGRVA